MLHGGRRGREERTFHQMSSGTTASTFLILSKGIQASHCALDQRVEDRRKRRRTHLVAQSFRHLVPCVFGGG